VTGVAAGLRRAGGAVASSPAATSIVLAFLLGAVMIAVTGNSPLAAYGAMLEGAFSGSGLRNTVTRTLPIVGMALAIAVPFRAGIVNLGGEGQMVIGGLAGTLAAIHLDGPSWLVVPVSLAVGMLVGAAWAATSALGQTLFRVPILITSLLLNWPARAITSYLVRFPFADPTVTSASTVTVPPSGQIPRLPLFGGVSVVLIVVIGLVIAIAVVNRRTVPGYETAMTGLNSRFSRYGGVDVPGQTVSVMVVSGAIGGFVGTYLITGEIMRFVDGDLVATAYAWTGLLVTLLARHRPGAILAAGAFFAALQVGGQGMQRTAGVPWQLAQVLQAVVIVMIASRFVVPRRRREAEPEEGEATLAVQPAEPDSVPVAEV
jgi:ABC-type uncharacterized transport system permease subunit